MLKNKNVWYYIKNGSLYISDIKLTTIKGSKVKEINSHDFRRRMDEHHYKW